MIICSSQDLHHSSSSKLSWGYRDLILENYVSNKLLEETKWKKKSWNLIFSRYAHFKHVAWVGDIQNNVLIYFKINSIVLTFLFTLWNCIILDDGSLKHLLLCSELCFLALAVYHFIWTFDYWYWVLLLWGSSSFQRKAPYLMKQNVILLIKLMRICGRIGKMWRKFCFCLKNLIGLRR